MKRVCFLVPDIVTTKKIAEECHNAGVTDSHIHVVGKNQAIIEHIHLHQANLWQTTDLPRALLRGVIFGSIIGLIMGLILAIFAPLDLRVGILGVVGFTILGGILGLWASGMVGIGITDPTVEKYAQPIEQGNYLMIIDVSKEQEAMVTPQIARQYPQVKVASSSLVH